MPRSALTRDQRSGEGLESDLPRLTSHRGALGFRPDVEGIRALAVLMVLMYHAHVPGVTGGFVGVDVFFVVSGFLITGLLLRELSTSGRVDFARFYARRAKRLLPAGTLVLVLTAMTTWLVLPVSRWPSVATDIEGAGLFVVNWVFARRSTDYLGAEEAASPVQHFWSLSVEEQFYFMWPALLTTFAVIAARRGARLRRSLLAAMGSILIPSLAYSLWATAHSPAAAYFSTFTRLWEMALGGIIALLASEFQRIPAWVRVSLGWAGLIAVAGSAVLINEGTPFPGAAALAPTLGAAALIVAGMGRTRGPASNMLSLPLMVWVGGLSYSLYLWHWPAIAITTELWPSVGWTVLVVVTVVSGIAAYLSLRFIENPVRHAATFRTRSGLALAMGAALVSGSVVAGQALQRASGVGGSVDLSSVPAQALGAGQLLDRDWVAANAEPRDSFVPLAPRPVDAPMDNPVAYLDGCQVGRGGTEVQDCQYGDPDAVFQIAIAGDSHATSWLPTLTSLGRQRGWGVRSLLKSRCPLTDSMISDSVDASPYVPCEQWKSHVRARLAEDPPDLLILTSVNYVRILDRATGQQLSGAARDREIRRGFRVVAHELERHGTTPVFIADTPLMRRDGQNTIVPDCVAEHLEALSECATPRSVAVDERNPLDRILSADPDYRWRTVDLTDGLCLPDSCPAAVGHVIVYRDYGHLTKTYAETMVPWMAEGLDAWVPGPGSD